MKKRFQIYALIWAVVLAAFNVICFITPNEIAGMNKFGGAFWTGYIFITAALIGQLICAYIVLKTDDKRKLFYNIPMIRVSLIGLILTFVFGALVMAIPGLPNWIGIIACVLILAFTAIAVIKASAAADIVEKVDKKVSVQTLFIRSLTVDAESLMTCTKTEEARSACKKVYEAARYSDPMSSEALSDIESQIALKFAAFSDLIKTGQNAEDIADALVFLIDDRNKICKRLK